MCLWLKQLTLVEIVFYSKLFFEFQFSPPNFWWKWNNQNRVCILIYSFTFIWLISFSVESLGRKLLVHLNFSCVTFSFPKFLSKPFWVFHSTVDGWFNCWLKLTIFPPTQCTHEWFRQLNQQVSDEFTCERFILFWGWEMMRIYSLSLSLSFLVQKWPSQARSFDWAVRIYF